VTADGYTLCGVLDAVGGGAGIYNRGQLVLTWSTVSGNRALGTTGVFDAASYGGGLRNTGAASVQNSDFAGNFAGSGGGVYNSGGLDISTSRIADNDTRFWAGGLENVGVATLRRVTVSGNVDGGIVNGDMTGRLGLLSVQNSTVSGNQSFRVPGSVTNVAGTVKIGSSTIAGNSSTLPGAGLAGPSIYLANTIVANGSDGDCERAVVSWGNNLVGDGSCGLTDPSDLPFTDPMLGPLADNGGPTPTRALLPGSPAIDRIPVQQCRPHQTGSVDQRGVARPQPDGGACDIGAYELPPPGGGGGF